MSARGKFPDQSTTKELETGLDGKLTSLPDNNPTNGGFVFVGWSTSAAETGGEEVTTGTTFERDIVIYARWE